MWLDGGSAKLGVLDVDGVGAVVVAVLVVVVAGADISDLLRVCICVKRIGAVARWRR